MFQIRHAWHIQVRRILVHQHKWESSGRGHPLSGVAWPKLVLLSKEPNGVWFQQVQISNPDTSIYYASDQPPLTCSFFLVKVVLGSDLWRWLNEDLESWVSESKSPAVKRFETTLGCKVQKLGTAKGAGVTRKVWENPWIVLYYDFCCLLSKVEEIELLLHEKEMNPINSEYSLKRRMPVKWGIYSDALGARTIEGCSSVVTGVAFGALGCSAGHISRSSCVWKVAVKCCEVRSVAGIGYDGHQLRETQRAFFAGLDISI